MTASGNVSLRSTTREDAALRTAVRQALAAYRRADEARQLLNQQQSVRPWTPEQARQAAVVAREAQARRLDFERLAGELDRSAI